MSIMFSVGLKYLQNGVDVASIHKIVVVPIVTSVHIIAIAPIVASAHSVVVSTVVGINKIVFVPIVTSVHIIAGVSIVASIHVILLFLLPWLLVFISLLWLLQCLLLFVDQKRSFPFMTSRCDENFNSTPKPNKTESKTKHQEETNNIK